MDENKYVFRFYNVYTDPENRDKFSFNSPYANRGVNIAPYTKLGETQYDTHKPRPDADYLIRDKELDADEVKALGGEIDEETDVPSLPHRGLSVIGLNDPRYSLYPFNILDYNFITDDNGEKGLRFNRSRFNNLPKLVQDEYQRTFNSFLNDKYRFKYDLFDLFDDNNKFVNPANNTNGELRQYISLAARDAICALRNAEGLPGRKGSLTYSKNGLSVIPKGFEWSQLIGALGNTYNWSDANALVLAQLPESALYTVDDYAKGKLAAHPDFPEEFLAKYVTPVKVKGTSVAKGKEYNQPENSNITRDINNYIAERRFDEKRNDVNRQYWEDRARTFIENNFNIDSNKIVSDEIKKYIYKDLSSWYNKHNTAKNVLNGLTQGGNRWQ